MAFFKNLITTPFSAVFNAASALVLSVTAAVATAADLRNFFKLIDMLPGTPERPIDDELMGKSLAFVQMGQLTCALTFTAEDGIAAEFIRTDNLSPDFIEAHAQGMDFSISTLSGGDNEPPLNLIVNKTSFNNHQNGVTADLLAQALLIPIDSVPVIGGTLADTLRRPVRAIATFLFSGIAAAASSTTQIVRNALPGGPAPG